MCETQPTQETRVNFKAWRIVIPDVFLAVFPLVAFFLGTRSVEQNKKRKTKEREEETEWQQHLQKYSNFAKKKVYNRHANVLISKQQQF